MSSTRKHPALGAVLYVAVIFSLGMYFTFAAVQGDFGLFRRVQIEAEAQSLRARHAALTAELEVMRNKTHRLSDDYLDLDLLDEQARSVLGLVRADEIVIR
ncbi:cell division protein FtsB [Rhodovulum iodosum]|uniref:Cell division protein FtsB n=1 Tax=Rhodovulum iodosum TaxID=68291 RepID=A0ABV3XVA1_9RHOB|nr:septum formation initiator family protein [Rhodovulum robiginosum]RSK33550.1 septum formation initiator family protein [Rhodovulum robiginosum]